MKRYFLLLSAVLLFTSCNDRKYYVEPDPAQMPHALTDFNMIPIKDAEWEIVTQGIYKDGKVDMKQFFHTYISCTGEDTTAIGMKYYKYLYQNENGDGVLYLREDTASQRIYALVQGMISPEGMVVDFGLDEVGDPASVPQQWPASLVASEDSAIVAKQYLKQWQVTYLYDKTKKFFYRGYGVGGQTGIIPSIMIAKGTQPVSIDFTYKGETLHYDFEVH
jgi:hypothetical protein